MRSSDEEESEATRIYGIQTNREFQREFFGVKNSSIKDIEYERKIRQLTLRAVEAESRIQEYKNIAFRAKSEATEAKDLYSDLSAKHEKIVDENSRLKADIHRLSEVERDSIAKKCSVEFLTQNYRSALTKYKAWYEYQVKQLEVMREILVDVGKWTTENRYRIYFSYKGQHPNTVIDEEVSTLAQGSVLNYTGIDDIDNLDTNLSSTRFSNNSTQTDDEVNTPQTSNDIISSIVNTMEMTNSEIEFLDLREKLRRFEQEAYNLKDQMNILVKKGDPVKLAEENERLSKEVVELKQKMLEMEGNETMQNTLVSDDIVKELEEEKKKNDELLKKTVDLEEQLKDSVKPVGPSGDTTVNQTVDPSVVFYHLRDNPFSAAVKDYEEREAKRMKLDPEATLVDYQKYSAAIEKVNKLQEEIRELNEKKEKLKNNWSSASKTYLNIVKRVTGYDIKIRDEPYIEVSNVYDLENHLVFERDGGETKLLENNYALSLKHLFEKYLPGSLPAFTAALTLDLYEKHKQDS